MNPYERLAELVSSQCPPDFSRAVLLAELDEGWSNISLAYWMSDDRRESVRVEAAVISALHSTLHTIQKCMEQETEGEKWTHCEYELFRDGKFDFQVRYP